MANVHQLNLLADGFLSGNIMHKFAPMKTNSNCSVTLCPKEAAAFMLNDIISSSVKAYERDLKTEDQAVARIIVPYSSACRWLENPSMFYYEVSLYVNNMLCSLVDTVGDLKGREVICARPGASGKDYFREMENVAGYELRLFVK